MSATMVIKTDPVVSEIKREVDKSGLDDAKKVARDTGEELDQDVLINLQTNALKIEDDIAQVKKELKDPELTRERQIGLRIRLGELKSNLTEARRNLQNFRNTGDKTLSRLQAKFDDVTSAVNSQGQAIQQLFSGDFVGGFQTLRSGFLGASGGAKTLLAVLGPITLAVAGLATVFSTFGGISRSFETAFAGVKKTLDGTPEQFATLRKEIEGLTKELPESFEGLSRIAELGGQLGVPIESISGFTKTVSELGIATGLASEEIATSLARIASVTNTPLSQIDRLGSALTDLGNNFAANEGEILAFTNRIAGAGSVIGASSQELFGIATAFTQVGLTAEAGGSSVSKAFLAINNAVNQGGESLNNFAQIAGVTSEEFVKQYEENATQAFISFVEGLGKSGDNASVALESVLGKSSELQRTFLSLAQNSSILTDAVNTSTDAFDKNQALQDEVNKRLETGDSRLKILGNRFRIVGASIGATVSGPIISAFEVLTDFLLVQIPSGFVVARGAVQKFLARFSNGLTAIPTIIKSALNLGLSSIEDFVNIGIDAVNKLIKKLSEVPIVGEKIGNTRIKPITIDGFDVIDGGDIESLLNDDIAKIEANTFKSLSAIAGNTKKAVKRTSDDIAKDIQDNAVDLLGLLPDEDDDTGGGGVGGGTTEKQKDSLDDLERFAKGTFEKIEENAKKAEEEVAKRTEKLSGRIKSFIDDIGDGIEDQKKDIEDITKTITDTTNAINDAQKSIDDIRQGETQDLAGRFAQIQDEIQKEVQGLSGTGAVSNDRLDKLREEAELIEKTVGAEKLKQEVQEARAEQNLSEAEKIIQKAEEEVQKQQEIIDKEQERLAKLEETKAKEEALLERFIQKQASVEEGFTQKFGEELEKRASLYEDFLAKINSQPIGLGGDVSGAVNNGTIEQQNAQAGNNNNVEQNFDIKIEGSQDPNAIANEIVRISQQKARSGF